MSKSNAAPTHGWVIMSHFYKWVAWLFLIVVFVVGVVAWGMTKELDKDCVTTQDQTFVIAGYWIDFSVGQTNPLCTQPPTR